jgi:hypothetical protein
MNRQLKPSCEIFSRHFLLPTNEGAASIRTVLRNAHNEGKETKIDTQVLPLCTLYSLFPWCENSNF